MRGQLYLLLAVTILPFVLLSGARLVLEWHGDRELAHATIRAEARALGLELDRHHLQLQSVLGALTALSSSAGGLPDSAQLADILATQPETVRSLFIRDSTGRLSGAGRDPDRLLETPPEVVALLAAAQATPGPHMKFSPVVALPVEQVEMVFAANAHRAAGRAPIAVAVGTDIVRLRASLEAASRIQGARAELLFGEEALKVPPQSLSDVNEQVAGFLAATARAEQLPWALRLQLPIDRLHPDGHEHHPFQFFAVALLMLMVGLAFGTRMARAHHVDVQRLRDQVNAFAADDTARRPQLGLSGELGELEVAFRRMADKITAQRDELAAEGELYLRLSRGAADWIWEQDAEFRFTRFHFLVDEGQFHIQPDAGIGKRRWELGYENLSPLMWQEHIALLRQHKPFRNLILQRRLADGSMHVIRTSGDPQFDSDGSFIGYRGTGADITKAFQAESAVAMAERRWVAALEGAGHAVWDWDLNTNCIFRSRTWGQMLGLGADAALDELALWHRLVHPDDRGMAEHALREHSEGRAPRLFAEFRLRHADGSWRWMLDRGMAIAFNPDGSPSRLVGTQTDITAEKETALALRESEQRLTAIFMNAALPMMISDVQTREIIRVNHAFERILEITSEEAVGRKLADLGVWPDPATPDDLYAELARKGSLSGVEVSLRSRSGRISDMLLFVDVVEISGRPVIIAQGYDVTEQNRAKRSLDEATRWARTLVDFSPTGMILTRRSDATIVEVNDRACQLLEYAREELVGASVRSFDHWAHPEQLKQAEETLASQGSLSAFRMQLRAQSGRLKDVMLYCELVVLDGEQYVLNQAIDVTELARTQQALAESEQRMKTIFTHGPMPMVLADVDTQAVIQVNPALEKVLGMRGEDVVGKSLFELGIWTNLAERERMYEQLARVGRVENMETRFRTPAGELLDYQISVEVIPYGGRRAILAHGFDITANRRALNEAERSRRWFRTLFEHSPISMTILDLDGRTIMANAACARMYGLPLEQIIGRTSGQNNLWVNLEDRDRFWDALQESGSVRDVVLARKRADGRPLHVLAYMDKFEIDGENFYITQGIDVTRAQESEQALRSLTALNSAAFNAVGESIVVHGLDGRVILVNAMAERILGSSGRQPLGATLLEAEYQWCALDGSAAVAERLPFNMVRDTGKPVHEQVIGLRAPTQRWFSVSCEPIDQDGDGVLEGTVTSFFDITDRVRAEAELRVLLDRMQLQLERMPIACFLTDEAFNVVYWNPASYRMFGYSAEEMLGRSAEILTPEYMRAMVRQIIHGTLTHPSGVDFANENLTRSGKRITCEWRSNSLFGADGKFVATMHMAIDMTDVIENQRRLQRSNEDLEQRVAQRTSELSASIRELELFSYTVAHDLRAPLRALDGYSYLLAEGGPNAAGFLSKIRANVAHMTGLIDGLLSYGRIGRQAIHPQWVDMHRVADVVVTDMKQVYPQARFRVGPMVNVMGDESLLRQVLTNLVGNACKFSSNTGLPSVELWCEERENDRARFHVRDNGVGFDMQYARKLFGVFERLHRQDEFSGSGIGLSIVKRIVERHGGKVGADSLPGNGATFWFELPVHQAPVAEGAAD